MRVSRTALRKMINEELGDVTQKPKLFFLIGPPAVGKSEWIKLNKIPGSVVINRDQIVENIAETSGVGTYDEMFMKAPEEIVPPGMPTKEDILNPDGQIVNDYVERLVQAANSFNADPDNSAIIEKYGRLVPFDKNDLELVLVKFNVPSRHVIPFEYSNVKRANNDVRTQFDLIRKKAASEGETIILDMVNMSIEEREMHRKFLVAAIEGSDPNKANSADINKYYDQIAIAFAPKQGYTPEVRMQIKKVAEDRAEAMKKIGKSKTIPGSTYDRWFSTFTPPSPNEGFTQISYVGVPSLGLDESILRKFIRTVL